MVRMRYELVAGIVERVMGVERAELLSSKKEEATDARSIFVWVLSDDLTDGEMAACMGLTRQAVSNTPVWDEIDRLMAELSDKEFERVANDAEFKESQQVVMNILQAVQMRMMRPMVEGTPEGKKALEEHLQLVKHLKRSVHKEVDAEMKDFEEYRAHYAHLSWEEYQAQKAEPKKGGKR